MQASRQIQSRLISLFITITLAYTWLIAGVSKFTAGGVPDFFTERFGNSILAIFPGLSFAYWSVAILEVFVAGLTLISLIRLEFWREKYQYLRWSLVGSLGLFAQLGFGLRLTSDFNGAANLFFYFGATLLMYMWTDNSSRLSN